MLDLIAGSAWALETRYYTVAKERIREFTGETMKR